jgi:hypothetical protein
MSLASTSKPRILETQNDLELFLPGTPLFSGPARFLWKNEIVEHDYCWTITFTREDLREDLIREAEEEGFVLLRGICNL